MVKNWKKPFGFFGAKPPSPFTTPPPPPPPYVFSFFDHFFWLLGGKAPKSLHPPSPTYFLFFDHFFWLLGGKAPPPPPPPPTNIFFLSSFVCQDAITLVQKCLLLFYQYIQTYSRLSLSRIPRDSLKHFEISIPRTIRVAEMRKTINRTTKFN